MTNHHVEISLRGHSVKVPALHIGGNTVVVTGRWLKVAALYDEDWIEAELQDLESCISRLKDRHSDIPRADIFAVTQKVSDVTPRFSHRMEWESVAAIRLDSYDEWWTNGISGDARKDVRRSVKRGVVVRAADFDDELVRGIVGIYGESPIRQGKAFWHYRKDFETVRREKSTYGERSVFLGAYHQDELIGFMKIVYVGKVAAMMQILAKISHYDKRPANALIAKAVEHCSKDGMSYLTYGRYRNRNKGVSSLSRFKHRMGFREVLVPKFYVPLTTKGRICLALRLHRDLVTLLPERLIDLLYGARTTWSRWRLRGHHGDRGRDG